VGGTAADLLVPSGGDEAQGRARLAAAEALLATLALPGVRARLVDSGAGPAATAAALLRATDGDVAFLSDGAACPDADGFAAMTAWALHPQAGPVGLSADDWSTAARLDGGAAAILRPGISRAASFVSFGLMAVAAQRLTAVGDPFDGQPELDGAAALWGLALQAHGWQPLALAGRATGTAPLPPPTGALPWPTLAFLRARRLLP
jgi:hypothetical protein